MIDKEQAITLRKQGLTYKEISQQLGCSEIWCKTNLKGVPKFSNEENELIKELSSKAKSKTGVTKYQLKEKIIQEQEEFDKKAVEEQLDKYLRILRKDRTNLIRPGFMPPDKAKEALDTLVENFYCLDDRLDELAWETCLELQVDPKVYAKAFKKAMITLFDFQERKGSTAFTNYLESLIQVQIELDKRNKE